MVVSGLEKQLCVQEQIGKCHLRVQLPVQLADILCKVVYSRRRCSSTVSVPAAGRPRDVLEQL